MQVLHADYLGLEEESIQAFWKAETLVELHFPGLCIRLKGHRLTAPQVPKLVLHLWVCLWRMMSHRLVFIPITGREKVLSNNMK